MATTVESKGSLAPKKAANRHSFALGDEDLLMKLGDLKQIPKTMLMPDPEQPRKAMDPESLAELRASLEEHGMLQPILVTEKKIGEFQILAGERRWRAAMSSEKITAVPVIVRADLTDDLRVLLVQIAENIHRANMNPLETAIAYKRVYEAVNKNQDEAAKLLGVSKSRLCQVLAVDDAPEKVKALVEDGVTSDVNVVAGLSTLAELNEEKAEQLIDQVRSGELKGGGLREAVKTSVREEKAERKARQKRPVSDAKSEAAESLQGQAESEPSSSASVQIDPQTEASGESKALLSVRMEKNLADELSRILSSISTDGQDAKTIQLVLQALAAAKQE